MFAPKIAESKTRAKASADPANGLTHQHSTFAAYRPGRDLTVQRSMLRDFSRISAFPPDRPDGGQARPQLRVPPAAAVVQAKLVVSQVDDPLERAADSTAGQVMRMPDPAALSAGGEAIVQHECQACQEGRSEACEKGKSGVCEKKETDHPKELALARAHDAPAFDAAAAAKDAQEVVSRPGRALEPSMRDFFEPRFGRDFSGVRVHADPRAAASARALGARAYTFGADIVFGPGRYQPGTEPGRRLLAHELAHVRQQGGAPQSVRAGVVQRQPDAGVAGTAPAPDSRVGTKAFNLILQHEFPVVSSSWFAGTQISLPPGGGVRADLTTGRQGQVLFDLSPDFAPAGKSADDTASDPGRIAVVRAEVIRVLDWRLGQGILIAKDIAAPFVTDHLRAMDPLALRALRGKPTVEPAAQAELDRILAITTKLPPGAQFGAEGAANLTVNGIRVRILPDTSVGSQTETKFKFVPDHLATPAFSKLKGRVTSIDGPIPTAPAVEIFTHYAAEGRVAVGDPLTATSGYGRGTTAADRASGHTSLRFHESQHGKDILDYLASHPFPAFTGKVGMTVPAFRQSSTDFMAKYEFWATEMGRVTLCATDCVGSPDIDTFEHNTGANMKCTTCRP